MSLLINSFPQKSFLQKIPCKFIFYFLLITSLFAQISFTPIEASLAGSREAQSSAQRVIDRFARLDGEIGAYGRSVSEVLLRCSYLQDAWLAYLHEAETTEEYLEGMTLLDEMAENFYSHCSYAGEVVNFFAPGAPRFLIPHLIDLDRASQSPSLYVDYNSKFFFPKLPFDATLKGYLNTFKTGRLLSQEEREAFFEQESTEYKKYGVVEPFTLNTKTLSCLESGVLYNFALLPSGKIRIAKEKPGGKDYQNETEAPISEFAYPNHTILAGSANQPVITAGALMLYRQGEKYLIFISPKSGHFAPRFHSLKAMKSQLTQLGVPPQTVIPVPTVNLAEVLFPLYYTVQIPISLDQINVNTLFELSHTRWIKAFENFNVEILEKLAADNDECLGKLVIHEINQAREEATYMRHAYQLYSEAHQSPKVFHKFVKRFGRLKDAIKHDIPDLIQSEAKWICTFLKKNEALLKNSKMELATADNVHRYVSEEIDQLKEIFKTPHLPVDRFHDIKKGAREIATLFLCLAEETQWKGKYHFVYEAAALEALRINELMMMTHDVAVGKVLRGEASKEELHLEIPPQVLLKLKRLLDQLKVPPERLTIQIEHEAAFWMINEAKDWYESHYVLSGLETQQRRMPHNPLPQKLLRKIVSQKMHSFTEEDSKAVDALKVLLRNAEIASNALHYLDIGHRAPYQIRNYISTLKRLLKGLEAQNFEKIIPEAVAMLKFLEKETTPTKALEEWLCTDQKSFERQLQSDVEWVAELCLDLVSLERGVEISARIQAIVDLCDLYLRIGQKRQCLPTVAFERTVDQGELLLKALESLLEGPCKENRTIAIPLNIKQMAEQLVKHVSLLSYG